MENVILRGLKIDTIVILMTIKSAILFSLGAAVQAEVAELTPLEVEEAEMEVAEEMMEDV